MELSAFFQNLQNKGKTHKTSYYNETKRLIYVKEFECVTFRTYQRAVGARKQ
jgi:hypothetical protein